MIIIEFLWRSAAWISFKLIRFFIWLFAARNCRHCKHCHAWRWQRPSCDRGYGALEQCQKHPCYAYFERKNKPKSFFDIL